MSHSHPQALPDKPLARWAGAAVEGLCRESLEALLANRIPAIRVPGFATVHECREFCAVTRAGPMRYYSAQPPIGYVGMAQYEYRWDRPKADYFRDVAQADAARDRVFAGAFDALARVNRALSLVWPGRVGLAHEPGLGDYFAGIIRDAAGGIKLHADWGPCNAPDWAVGTIDAQIGWNIYFEVPETGGDTTVYNAPWSPVMEGNVPPRSYGLDTAELAAGERFTFHPSEGELIFFNVRNPHEVSPGRDGERSRVSIGAFVGRMPDGSLVTWS